MVNSLLFLPVLFVLLCLPSSTVAIKRKPRPEKYANIRCFWQDILDGPRPTAITVVQPPSKASFAFGMTRMIDNPLTESVRADSKVLGRAQGFYSSSSQHDLALMMVMNLVFYGGAYNGSSLVVLGRNPALMKERELAVVSGTGRFRFARGYVLLQTRYYNPRSGDASVEYNIHVWHY